MNLTITDADTLDEISSEIHDSHFDIDDVGFDAAQRVLTIPFRRWSHEEARLTGEERPVTGWRKLFGAPTAKSWEAPWYRWILRIREADSYRLEDGAGVGGGDFHKISYDPVRDSVVLEGNLPVTIEARVRALVVDVQQTDELLGIAHYRTLGDSISYTGDVLPLPEPG